jgi:hypothetical protein
MSTPNRASSLRTPYPSSSKNVNVSAAVMSTPPHRGMVPLDKMLTAIAEPMT